MRSVASCVTSLVSMWVRMRVDMCMSERGSWCVCGCVRLWLFWGCLGVRVCCVASHVTPLIAGVFVCTHVRVGVYICLRVCIRMCARVCARM